MNPEQTIIEAIKRRKPIEFSYNRPDKVEGIRVGNPHIIFSGTTKDGEDRTWVHIAQTGGVSDTLVTFPDWRMFITSFIGDVRILEDDGTAFTLQPGYNPTAPMYINVIAQV